MKLFLPSPRLWLFWVLGLTLLGSQAQAQSNKVTLSGYVRDAKSGEVLIGAAVRVKESGQGTATNVYGFYSLTLANAASYTLEVSYIGYKPEVRNIPGQTNPKLNFELSEEVAETQEVVVTSQKASDNVKSMEMGVARLDIQTMSKMPALLGEVDVIRNIQLLPGVTTVGEGASGFNVRGGSVDQNLVLIDEAPVYNSSHLFGLFSVFNPDAVRDVKLVKGGIPAQYGGRLASILDVRLKEGNNKRTSVQGGLGLIFSRLTIESPIKKDKGSFIIAGRRSYGDVFLALAPDETLRDSRLYFYDLTAKANYQISDKDNIFISGYLGRDVFGFGDQFGFNWGNATATVRWNHLFGPRLFMNVTGFYSNYDYQLRAEQPNSLFDWKSRLINYSVKPEFSYYLTPKATLTFGGQTILYEFQPGKFNAKSEGEPTTRQLPSKYALENAAYVGMEQTLTERLSVQYGIRFSHFQYIGPGKAFSYNDTLAGERKELADVRDYKSGELIKEYWNPEPRFSLKYELDENSSVKASYNRTAQYIHLISNSTAAAPLDVWTPSTNNIKPQVGDQYALGYFRNFGSDNQVWEASGEVFYKTMENQIEYIDGADLLLNERLEGELLSGKGRAYGLELYLKKSTGKLTGWISYTLSRTERQVNGINNNEWYASRFDKTHNVYVVAMYDLNEKWSFGANFTYSTGLAATFPTNRYIFEGNVIPHNAYEQRNNYRLPASHRLDLSATLQGAKRKGEKWYQNYESFWTFSLYNVYARRNPFGVYFRQNENNAAQTEAIRFAVFGSVIPGVTYNFKF